MANTEGNKIVGSGLGVSAAAEEYWTEERRGGNACPDANRASGRRASGKGA
jgi:hypothetical protein